MASTSRRPGAEADRLKHGFFLLMGLCVLVVLWVDERFWFSPADPHWKHIAPVKWLLAVHGLGGATALTTGALQMSSRIRNSRTALHRALGKVYLTAVCISAPVAVYLGTSSLEPVSIRFEQIFQGSLWAGSALVAWLCIRSGQMALHKAWMMRSYAFTLIFITSRVPDAFIATYSDQFLSDLLWSLVVIGAISPEVILTAQSLWKIRRAKTRHAKASTSGAAEAQAA